MFKFVLITFFGISLGLWPHLWIRLFDIISTYLIQHQIIAKKDIANFKFQCDNILDTISPHLPPWRIVLVTCLVTLLLHYLYLFLFDHRLPIFQRTKEWIFGNFRRLPIAKGFINKEINKVRLVIEKTFSQGNDAPQSQKVIPSKGLTREEIFKECEAHAKMGDWEWKNGRVSGTVYVYDEDHTKMLEDVYSFFSESNPLHPDVFPGVRKMEAEIISMCLNLFHAQDRECGATTSGGTESILMAMKAYREVGYSRGIKYPEIVMNVSSHSAFMKAASYFGMRPVRLNTGEDYRLDVRSYKNAINSNTVVLIVSAPGFPHGVIDPVEEVAKLGLKYGVGVHVDCCLGGLLVPFIEETGRAGPVVDFRVEGVTSISCDTHKYGYGPKGCSVIMYKTPELRSKQYYVDADWTGGIYSSPCVAGSRSGVTLACTWATLIHIGRSGYVEKTQRILEIREEIEKEVRKLPELFVFGQPEVSVLAIGSKTLNIYLVSDLMGKKGWHLNNLQFPPGFHICITSIHIGKDIHRKFLADLKQSIQEARATDREASGIAGIYGMAMNIPDRNLVGEIAGIYVDSLFKT